MKPLNLTGCFDDKGFLWTRNRVPGRAVYGEKLRKAGPTEYRNWNPFRSKMAALARVDATTLWPGAKDDILYLGAASGTTVSHLSDVTDGIVFAVEFSSRAVRDLVWNIESRSNVVPILDDAGQPQRYAAYIAKPVAILVQDVAQRHQVDIFLRNLVYLRSGGLGFLMVKARSINVSESPAKIYEDVARRLREAGLTIERQADLDPFEKDHRAFVVRKP